MNYVTEFWKPGVTADSTMITCDSTSNIGTADGGARTDGGQIFEQWPARHHGTNANGQNRPCVIKTTQA